jgi:hypothetical protein
MTKYVTLASQPDDEEDTSSQISSDTSSTFSSSEEIQCHRTPTPDVILTQSSSSNVGVFRPVSVMSDNFCREIWIHLR